MTHPDEHPRLEPGQREEQVEHDSPHPSTPDEWPEDQEPKQL